MYRVYTTKRCCQLLKRPPVFEYNSRQRRWFIGQVNYVSRQFSSGSGDDRIVTYDEVLKINPDTLLVDVREPSELKETGVLPKSINIPLGEVESAFRDLSPGQFQKKYGIEKPDFTTPIVFSCKAGIRSDKAMRAVESIGYSKTKNYKGGWLDWEANTTKK